MTKTPTNPAPAGATGSTTDELPWDKRVLALLPPGVDRSQIRENLRLSPTERVERMLAFVAFAEEHRGRAHVRPAPAR